MKKKILVFFFLLLIIPMSVFAESLTTAKTFNFSNLETWIPSFTNYQYAGSFTYEDGTYHLVNPFTAYAYNLKYYQSANSPFYFTCKSATETTCETLYAVDKESADLVNSFNTAIRLQNGVNFDDEKYLYYSSEFTKEGDEYVLVDPSQEYVTRSIRNGNIRKFDGKFFCENRSTRCSELFVGQYNDTNKMIVSSSEMNVLFGRGFEFEDGMYTIKDVDYANWPDYDLDGRIYTCFSDQTTCENLYSFVNKTSTQCSYDTGGRLYDCNFSAIYGNPVVFDTDTLVIDMDDQMDATVYLTDSNSIWIEDEEIIKIEEDKIVPLKVGKTTVLIQKDTGVVLLHIEITEKDLVSNNDIVNPKTGKNIGLIMTILTVLACTLLSINNKNFKKSIGNLK